MHDHSVWGTFATAVFHCLALYNYERTLVSVPCRYNLATRERGHMTWDRTIGYGSVRAGGRKGVLWKLIVDR